MTKKIKAQKRYIRVRDNNIQTILNHLGVTALSCNTCGVWVNHFSFYDFHHRDPEQKIASISSMMGHVNTDKLLSEVDKCDVLCPSCHRMHHIEEKVQREKVLINKINILKEK